MSWKECASRVPIARGYTVGDSVTPIGSPSEFWRSFIEELTLDEERQRTTHPGALLARNNDTATRPQQ